MVITGTTAQTARRRLLNDAVDVATEVRTGSADAAGKVTAAMTGDALNAALQDEGLPAATITQTAAVKVIETGAAAYEAPSVFMVLGAVLASLALLF